MKRWPVQFAFGANAQANARATGQVGVKRYAASAPWMLTTVVFVNVVS
ncbi:hypothetical protein [Burkholderia ambifaria]